MLAPNRDFAVLGQGCKKHDAEFGSWYGYCTIGDKELIIFVMYCIVQTELKAKGIPNTY